MDFNDYLPSWAMYYAAQMGKASKTSGKYNKTDIYKIREQPQMS